MLSCIIPSVCANANYEVRTEWEELEKDQEDQ